ncbi:MAG: hypothetical protein J7L23_02290 [Candidatus Diapherotrites archaeon]|nr:hypothetical protein [Candidatus Diapherotrites archaeon]
MKKTTVIQIEVGEPFLKKIDRYKEQHFYRSRTELIRDLLREAILKEPELSSEELEEARREIREGKGIPHKEAMKLAGL